MAFFQRSSSDFPFEKTLSSKILPWVIGALIYLATLAILGCQGVCRTTESWNTALSRHITIEIPTTPKEKEESIAQLPILFANLGKISGIQHVERVPEDQVRTLVADWIKDTALLSSLDLPILVDVLIMPEQSVSTEEIRQAAETVFKNVAFHDHAEWYSPALHCATLFQFFSIVLALLTSIVVVGTIVFSTHTHLIVHQHIVNVLQLIGATDSYIARQLEKYMMRIGGQAVFLALCLSAITLSIFQPNWEGREEDSLYAWIIVASVPFFMITVVLCVTRLTVLWSLRKKELNLSL
ncbi:MAG: hypothetical protein LBD66_02385 [Holosporales bacterium]|jgi:cell division transport system permease protein|nr:hypothetical protein [Holosporales bacterium]